MQRKVYPFIAEYEYDGARWILFFKAKDFDDAERRCKVLNCRLLGEHMLTVPAALPFAQRIVQVYCALRNWLTEKRKKAAIDSILK